jgi:2-polyprenyl-3-methyl-5-hydroxy-6-metoxy-1,4-benzoquinol methylase
MSISDLSSPEAKQIIVELNELIQLLKARGQRISSWYGEFHLSGDPGSVERINRGYGYRPLADAIDDHNFPWFLYWEIAWVVMNAEFSEGQRVLDLGGSSSLFSFYLASKGLAVTTVDLQGNLVENGNKVAKAMNWNLQNFQMDMRDLNFEQQFDHITSICVYEHIPMFARVEINKHIKRLLTTGGRFSITFDYRNPSRFARINSPENVYEQFIAPSELSIRGNERFHDTGENYLLHPFYYPNFSVKYKLREIKNGHFPLSSLFQTKKENDYTFGSLFLHKA